MVESFFDFTLAVEHQATIDAKKKICKFCDGKGFTETDAGHDCRGNYETSRTTCTICKGHGKRDKDYDKRVAAFRLLNNMD